MYNLAWHAYFNGNLVLNCKNKEQIKKKNYLVIKDNIDIFGKDICYKFLLYRYNFILKND